MTSARAIWFNSRTNSWRSVDMIKRAAMIESLLFAMRFSPDSAVPPTNAANIETTGGSFAPKCHCRRLDADGRPILAGRHGGLRVFAINFWPPLSSICFCSPLKHTGGLPGLWEALSMPQAIKSCQRHKFTLVAYRPMRSPFLYEGFVLLNNVLIYSLTFDPQTTTTFKFKENPLIFPPSASISHN